MSAKSKPVTVCHVNQLVIRGNAKHGRRNPPLTIRGKTRRQKRLEYGHEAVLFHNGVEVGRFAYRPDDPLDCGAKVWFETDVLEIVPVVWENKK